MKTPVMTDKRRAFLFAVLTIVCFFASFIFAPLGSFMVWIFGGATLYFLFMSIYTLIPQQQKQFAQRRFDPRQAETKAYIASQKPILLSVFLAGLLLLIVILMAVL